MIILKASEDHTEDFYLEFCTSSDQPYRCGSSSYLSIDSDRKDRIDETGSSAFSVWGHPARGSFTSHGILIRDFGTDKVSFWLTRANFKGFLTMLCEDPTVEGQDAAMERFGTDLDT